VTASGAIGDIHKQYGISVSDSADILWDFVILFCQEPYLHDVQENLTNFRAGHVRHRVNVVAGVEDISPQNRLSVPVQHHHISAFCPTSTLLLTASQLTLTCRSWVATTSYIHNSLSPPVSPSNRTTSTVTSPKCHTSSDILALGP
jgi:hypothetical protein